MVATELLQYSETSETANTLAEVWLELLVLLYNVYFSYHTYVVSIECEVLLHLIFSATLLSVDTNTIARRLVPTV